MVNYSRKIGRDGAVIVKIPYQVSGALDMRNAQRSKFEPLEVVVEFWDGAPKFVTFKGRRYNEHRTWAATCFWVDTNGDIENSHNDVPPIVRALIEDASRHPAVLACRAAAAV